MASWLDGLFLGGEGGRHRSLGNLFVSFMSLQPLIPQQKKRLYHSSKQQRGPWTSTCAPAATGTTDANRASGGKDHRGLLGTRKQSILSQYLLLGWSQGDHEVWQHIQGQYLWELQAAAHLPALSADCLPGSSGMTIVPSAATRGTPPPLQLKQCEQQWLHAMGWACLPGGNLA